MTTSNPNRGTTILIQILVIVVILVGIAVIAINSGVFQSEPTGNQRVAYEIRGTASQALVTYTMPNLGVSESEFVDLPWRSATLIIPGENRVILTAANPEDSGTLECIIILNGTSWRREFYKQPGRQNKLWGFTSLNLCFRRGFGIDRI